MKQETFYTENNENNKNNGDNGAQMGERDEL